MKARVKATGEIVEIIRNSAFDKDVFYDSNGQQYNREELSFDVKEKSFSTDEPDYWEKLKHQYAGMAMQGLLGSRNHYAELTPNQIALDVCKYATALVNKLKEEQQ